MQDQTSAWGNNKTKFFYELTPDKILDAVEGAGYKCTGRCLALNSMENRVYEVEIDLETKAPKKSPWENFRIAKFYRPERWSRAQILQEHRFLQNLVEHELPVVAPIPFADGETLRTMPESPIQYAIFPKIGGRSFAYDELTEQQLSQLGRLVARIHNVGAITDASERLRLNPATYIESNVNYLLTEHCLPVEMENNYKAIIDQLLQLINPFFQDLKIHPVHGDFHLGNILWGNDGPLVVDFDDMVRAPAIQDLWLLVAGRDAEAAQRLDGVISAYQQMRDFDYGTIRLIEPLRTMRMIHFSAWIARRWQDPAFPKAFPYFGTPKYWQDHFLDLREQLGVIQNNRGYGDY